MVIDGGCGRSVMYLGRVGECWLAVAGGRLSFVLFVLEVEWLFDG